MKYTIKVNDQLVYVDGQNWEVNPNTGRLMITDSKGKGLAIFNAHDWEYLVTE